MVNNKKPECFAVCRLLLAHWDLVRMASSCKQGVDVSETGLDELFAQIPIDIGFAMISSPIPPHIYRPNSTLSSVSRKSGCLSNFDVLIRNGYTKCRLFRQSSDFQWHNVWSLLYTIVSCCMFCIPLTSSYRTVRQVPAVFICTRSSPPYKVSFSIFWLNLMIYAGQTFWTGDPH